MGLGLAQMHGWIVSELARQRPVVNSMDCLIDLCEAAQPHPDWAKLRILPYADLSPLVNWLLKPFQEEPPVAPLRGLYFGLFNPCPDGQTPVADIYVCGSERFNSDDQDLSWAVAPEWWPETRYASSSVFADIYRIAYRQGDGGDNGQDCLGGIAEYSLCLGYGAFAIRELLSRIEPSVILRESDSVGVAVGFDSGDFVLLGELTKDGLRSIASKLETSKALVEPVLEHLRSADSSKVFLAIFGLQQIGDRAREVVPDLVRIASTHEEFGLRQAAVNKIVAIASDDPRAKSAVLLALTDSSPFVRREALQALISIQELSSLDLAKIKDMEKDLDEIVARWSEIALRNIRLRREAAEPE